MVSAKVMALGSAAVLAGTAALQRIETPARPEAFWPVTVTGWVSLILSVGALVGMGYALHRFSQKGVLAKLKEMEEAAARTAEAQAKDAKEMREHFDKEVRELRSHYDGEIKGTLQLMEKQSNALSGALKERMDGFGGRVKENETELTSQGLILNGAVASLAESKMDRQHINNRVDQLALAVERDREMRGQFERQLFQMIADIRTRVS